MDAASVTALSALAKELGPFGSAILLAGLIMMMAYRWIKRVDDKIGTIHDLNNKLQPIIGAHESQTMRIKRIEILQKRERKYTRKKLEDMCERIDEIVEDVRERKNGAQPS